MNPLLLKVQQPCTWHSHLASYVQLILSHLSCNFQLNYYIPDICNIIFFSSQVSMCNDGNGDCWKIKELDCA